MIQGIPTRKYTDNELLLVDRLLSAAQELVKEHDWFFDGEGNVPDIDNPFIEVLVRHVGDLIDFEAFKNMRIKGLRAELEALENE